MMFAYIFQFDKLKLVCNDAALTELNLCYSLVDVMFSRQLFTLVSWAGGSKTGIAKIAFQAYQRTLSLFIELVRVIHPNMPEIRAYEFFKKKIISCATTRSKSVPKRVSREKNRKRSVFGMIDDEDTSIFEDREITDEDENANYVAEKDLAESSDVESDLSDKMLTENSEAIEFDYDDGDVSKTQSISCSQLEKQSNSAEHTLNYKRIGKFKENLIGRVSLDCVKAPSSQGKLTVLRETSNIPKRSLKRKHGKQAFQYDSGVISPNEIDRKTVQKTDPGPNRRSAILKKKCIIRPAKKLKAMSKTDFNSVNPEIMRKLQIVLGSSFGDKSVSVF